MVRATSSNVLRRITTLLIICCLLTVGLCVNTAAALPGSGAQEDPWRIESLADFDEFAADANYWSGYTRLETDVNLAGRTYSTAVIAPDVNNSNYEFGGTAFTGVFDGNGHKIIGLTIEGGGARYYCLGFFGCIDDGQVGNLGLEGGSVSGDCFVGGLVGWNEGGSISSCYSTGTISGGANVGGLVGLNEGGSISNCYSSGSVSGTSCVGGLVGQGGTITNCYSTGSVTGDYVSAGWWDSEPTLRTAIGPGLSEATRVSADWWETAPSLSPTPIRAAASQGRSLSAVWQETTRAISTTAIRSARSAESIMSVAWWEDSCGALSVTAIRLPLLAGSRVWGA